MDELKSILNDIKCLTSFSYSLSIHPFLITLLNDDDETDFWLIWLSKNKKQHTQMIKKIISKLNKRR